MSEEKEIDKGKVISYTQFSMWKECPFRWKLNYIDRKRIKIETINTLFGRAMHEVLQKYLEVFYGTSVIAADALDLPKMLMERMMENFKETTSKNIPIQTTPQEMTEFWEQGTEIIYWFMKNKGDYFSKRGHELVGCEVPIEFPVQSGVKMYGFLDVVIRDTVLNRIQIFDFKTSHQGWNKYQKADKGKLMQLVLYKTFYAEQYGYNPKDVTVEFLILKRKLFEKADWPQKRIQRITPASGSITTKEVLNELREFVGAVFDEEGKYRASAEYPKNPSTKTCKYCEFSNRPDICDKNNPKRAVKLLAEKKNG